MVTISARCPTCGEVEFTSADIRLVIYEDQSQLSFYAFRCPHCTEEVRKPADDRIISLLMDNAGICPLRQRAPAEAFEQHTGAAITYNDVLEFARAIESTRYPATLARYTYRA